MEKRRGEVRKGRPWLVVAEERRREEEVGHVWVEDESSAGAGCEGVAKAIGVGPGRVQSVRSLRAIQFEEGLLGESKEEGSRCGEGGVGEAVKEA